MKKLITFTLAIFIVGSLSAQTSSFKTTKEAHTFAEEMVKKIIAGQAITAFDAIKPYWPLDPSTISGLATTTAEQLPMLEDSYGKLMGYEFVGSETLGTSGHLENFIIKYEQSALRFYIVFYNGGTGWIVNSLSWDDSWDLLFKTKIQRDK
jgi:hypothetical protein